MMQDIHLHYTHKDNGNIWSLKHTFWCTWTYFSKKWTELNHLVKQSVQSSALLNSQADAIKHVVLHLLSDSIPWIRLGFVHREGVFPCERDSPTSVSSPHKWIYDLDPCRSYSFMQGYTHFTWSIQILCHSRTAVGPGISLEHPD